MATIRQTIESKGSNILNIYFTAGHPTLESVPVIISELEKAGADLIELGMPYSDPLADGPAIQRSSEIALRNGQTIAILFSQVKEARKTSSIPLILMGYYNQLIQYGEEKFVKEAHDAGIQGLIIPDLPMEVYESRYKDIFDKYGMEISFLITPMTSDERIRQADRLSSAFIYVVSKSSVTGKQEDLSEEQLSYLDRIRAMDLKSPALVGFGIFDRNSKQAVNRFFNGVIVGSAFIRALEAGQDDLPGTVRVFMEGL